jgi:hypothetical protein
MTITASPLDTILRFQVENVMAVHPAGGAVDHHDEEASVFFGDDQHLAKLPVRSPADMGNVPDVRPIRRHLGKTSSRGGGVPGELRTTDVQRGEAPVRI